MRLGEKNNSKSEVGASFHQADFTSVTPPFPVVYKSGFFFFLMN